MNEMPEVQTMRQAIETPATATSRTTRRLPVRRAALVAALLTGTALAGYYGHDYWITGRFQVSTDDAYVKADSTTIAPKCRAIWPTSWCRTTNR
jgi:membrane fusion protein (multidrug efflux system)